MHLLDACAPHLLSLSAEGRSASTLRLYRLYEGRFIEYLTEQKLSRELDALSPPNVRNALVWFRERPTTGARGGQVAQYAFIVTLKSWASFLEAEGVFTESPLARLKRPRVDKVLRQ